MRENGYYWVKYNDEWMVGMWWAGKKFNCQDGWSLPGDVEVYQDEDMDEIGGQVERELI